MSPVLFLLAPVALSADSCPSPVALDDLAERIDRAEAAYGSLDVDGFIQATDTVGLMVPCLSAPLTPQLAGRAHRALALLHWAEERPDDARLALAAAQRLLPGDAALPTDLVATGHPLQTVFVTATPGALVPTPEPAEGALMFDGVDSDRPADEPTIAQWVVADAPRWTQLLAPDDPLPEYATPAVVARVPAAVAVVPVPAPVPAAATVLPPKRSTGLSTALWATAGVSAVGAGGLYGGAWATNASFHQYNPAPGEGAGALDALEGKQATATALTAGAITLGVVALGSSVVALVVR